MSDIAHRSDEDWMRHALTLAQRAQAEGEVPVGAVLVQDDEIIGEGWNQVTSTNDPSAHAEVTAIRAACKNISHYDLSGAEIYTSCEPCPMCLSAIYWARISKIYYGNTRKDAANIQFDDDFLYQEIPKAIEDRKIPMQQCAHAEALKVFQAWEKKADKVPY